MVYKKLKHIIYNNNLINKNDFKKHALYQLEVDKLLFLNLQKCINENIKIEIDDNDFIDIYKIYLKLLKHHYPVDKKFLSNIENLTTKDLNYFNIIQEITE